MTATTTKNRLRIIYTVTTFLSLFMLFWILIIPATAFVGLESDYNLISAFHQKIGFNFREAQENVLIPPRLLDKYIGHTLVKMTHQLPTAIWSACVPLQFHPSIRRNYRSLHRYTGRLFAVSSYISMGGVFILLRRNLGFSRHLDLDLDLDLLPEEHKLHIIPILKMTMDEAQLLFLVGGWFLYTLTRSIYYARQKDFANHQRWMVRHVAGGIWVAVQRLLVGIIGASHGFLIGKVPVSGHVQGLVFGQSGVAAIIGCVLMGEYTIRLMNE
mmetsp:Transcript_25394/g.38818  ORF Transcript_25394/g.38818 Transcript_25394/m.38818 type:complete len:271 (-) Transcript_25394:1060-1872(-)